MISFNSLKIFITLNSLLCTSGYIEYLIDNSLDFFITFNTILLKNYFFISLIDYNLKSKKVLESNKRTKPIESFYKEFDMFVVSSTFTETCTSLIVKSYILENKTDIFYDLIYFIPISFCYEIVFDFFHYITHFISHSRYIYPYTHKLHHKHKYPTSILTFYHHPLDLIITNMIPNLLTIYIGFSNISLFQYKLLTVYKTFIEISGHSGKEYNGSSFTQFFWLPKFFNIHLKTEDHDLHHSANNCNYAKRFTIYDKIFGTYKKIEKVKI